MRRLQTRLAHRGVTRRVQAYTAGGHWLERAFTCVKHYESDGNGGWQANTGNGYHGGLQLDAAFERRYGREFLRAWGHAEAWPASVQIAVAIRAWLHRGFTPWPTTRRRCGV